MRNPRGRVRGTNRPIPLRDGVAVRGTFPMLVVTLKVGSNRNVADVCFWLGKLGLGSRLVQVIGEGSVEAYEVWGHPDSLERFVTFGFVQSYHLPVSCRVGWQGAGAGESCPAHRKPLPHAVQAVRREDHRAAAASAAKAQGYGDDIRRHKLFC